MLGVVVPVGFSLNLIAAMTLSRRYYQQKRQTRYVRRPGVIWWQIPPNGSNRMPKHQWATKRPCRVSR